MPTALESSRTDPAAANGAFVDLDGERFYAIEHFDRMPAFFISVISNVDHWLFVSSTGGLTAGRVSPDTALFPYQTVDKIHDSYLITGPRTMLRVGAGTALHHWEPFNREQDRLFETTRNLYKSGLGNKLCFEEINHDLELGFRYTWSSSDEFGFVRRSELLNAGDQPVTVEVLDGLQNILPAGTPRFTQTNSSNLVDAYKWTEVDEASGLALFTLYSGITDRAEPCESLKANTAFCLGLDAPTLLVSSEQLDDFRHGATPAPEPRKRGIRGAFFVHASVELAPEARRDWHIVTDVEQTQAAVVDLRRRLADRDAVAASIEASVARGSDGLARIMSVCDGFQATAEENVSEHHYQNVLFNVLRGGYFFDQHTVTRRDFTATVAHFNKAVLERNLDLFEGLPETLPFRELAAAIRAHGDDQLLRLCQEYLPITFGRRHGDPSRPWNQFSIRLEDRDGEPLLSYEGNWRDIFQNWEALAFSYPEFVENMVAKFVNASTMDGYNPYRITKEGIDWEVEDPDDPWSYIGYWGDHQIIYLAKLLELSRDFHPERLGRLLHEAVFAYANVPYRIRPFDALLDDPKSTVDYDDALAERIEDLEARVGADARLVLDGDGEVYLVTLLEKLLVPLLAKLGNLVVDGGIWMNTQRPEWNDANNALVGQGLSMVTLYYLRRYVRFVAALLDDGAATVELTREVATWLDETAQVLREFRPDVERGPTPASRLALLTALGESSGRFREQVYLRQPPAGKTDIPVDTVRGLLDDALAAIDRSIGENRREDGMYHAYNLAEFGAGELGIDRLYPMLEGQVAALSSGAIEPGEAADIVEALFDSDIYRADQHSFMLYPDRALPGFLDKNRIPADAAERIPLIGRLVSDGNRQVVVRDADGCLRFNAGFTNGADLEAELGRLPARYADDVRQYGREIRHLFETVFRHQAFTGRSGTMFGFEGLGCIYWHMVSKLLLALQENCFRAIERGADAATTRRLNALYYRVRAGLGFNKSPAEYGAFPTDPYSHTPGHGGARQPGMTGQVKEEVLSRFGELGIRVRDGHVRFEPALLRPREFRAEPGTLRFVDVDGDWQQIDVPAGSLAFTWCQVPIVYRLDDGAAPSLALQREDGRREPVPELVLDSEASASLFSRAGRIRRLDVSITSNMLFDE